MTRRRPGRRQTTSQPDHGWLSHGFLRAHSGSRAVDWTLLGDDRAWAQPLMREHFPPRLRQALVRLHEQRESLLGLIERLPRTLGHLDVWPNNVIRRSDGQVVLLDWAFTGDGALGEDIGNLILNALLPPEALDDLDRRLTDGYVSGLHLEYGRGVSVDADARYAAHATALALCARWADVCDLTVI